MSTVRSRWDPSGVEVSKSVQDAALIVVQCLTQRASVFGSKLTPQRNSIAT